MPDDAFCVGIDLGLQHTGIAWRTATGDVDTFRFSLPQLTAAPLQRRIRHLAQMAHGVVKFVLHRDHDRSCLSGDRRTLHVAIEGYASGPFLGGDAKLELGGAVRAGFVNSGLEIAPFIIQPSTARKLALGASVQKALAVRWAREVLGRQDIADDEADAFVIMRAMELILTRAALPRPLARVATECWIRNHGRPARRRRAAAA